MATKKQYFAQTVNAQLLEIIRKLIADAEFTIDDLRQKSHDLHATTESDLKRKIHDYLKDKVEKLECELLKVVSERVSTREVELEKNIAELEKRKEILQKHERDVSHALPPSSLSHLNVTKKDLANFERAIHALKDKSDISVNFNFCRHVVDLVEKCQSIGDVKFVKTDQKSKLDEYVMWSCPGDIFHKGVASSYRKRLSTPGMTSNVAPPPLAIEWHRGTPVSAPLGPIRTHRSQPQSVISLSPEDIRQPHYLLPMSASSAPAGLIPLGGTVTTHRRLIQNPSTIGTEASDLESVSSRSRASVLHDHRTSSRLTSSEFVESLPSRRLRMEPKLRAVTEYSFLKSLPRINYIQFDRTLDLPKQTRTRSVYGLDFLEDGKPVLTDSRNRLLYFNTNNETLAHNTHLKGIPYDLSVLPDNRIVITLCHQLKNLLKVMYIGNQDVYKTRFDMVIDCPLHVHCVCSKNEILCVACPRELIFFAVDGVKLYQTDRFTLRHRDFDRLRTTRYDVACNSEGTEFYYIQSDLRRLVCGRIEETVLEGQTLWKRRWSFNRQDVVPSGMSVYDESIFVTNSLRSNILELASNGEVLREIRNGELNHPERIRICEITRTILVVQDKKFDDDSRINKRAQEAEVLVFSFD